MQSRRLSMLLGAVLPLVMLAACTTTDAANGSSIPQITPALLAAMPEAQAQILEDGSVDDSEFERAILGLVACLEATGFVVTDVSIDSTGWSLGYQSAFDDPAKDDAAYDICYTADVEHVEAYYLAERQPSAEERERERTGMIDCLHDAGIEVRDDADWGEIQSAIPQDAASWVRCNELQLTDRKG